MRIAIHLQFLIAMEMVYAALGVTVRIMLLMEELLYQVEDLLLGQILLLILETVLLLLPVLQTSLKYLLVLLQMIIH